MADSFKNYVLDQLKGLERLSCRPMFGGYGLYDGNIFFGILHKGRLYFKTHSTTGSAFREKKMKPFRPNRNQTLKSYYEVPAEILEDRDELVIWANRASKK